MNWKHRGLMLAGLITAGSFAPRQARACHEVEVCVRFKVEADDLPIGDLPEVGQFWGGGPIQVPGRGLRVALIPPVPEPPFEAVLDNAGCFTFVTEWVWGHKLLVYPEGFHGDSDNIRVMGYETYSKLVADEPIYPWLGDLKNLGEDAQAILHLDADDAAKRLFIWANWVVGRLEDELNPGLSGEAVLRLYSQEPEFAEIDGDASAHLGGYGTATRIYIRPAMTYKRFAIAHEVGHWLHANWVGLPIGGGVNYPAQDDACKFKALGTNSVHGLRSAEHGDFALREGFAHFISAWVFDDTATTDAQFKYYKSIIDEWGWYEDLIDNDNIVSLLGGSCDENYVEYPDSCPQSGFILGGDSAWIEYKCPNDWAHQLDVRGHRDQPRAGRRAQLPV